jgi:hypothetical protein
MTNYIAKEIVQETLTKIGYNNSFKVVFDKSDGTEREMDAMMIKPEKPVFKQTDNVPVIEIWKEEWRSFNLNRVKQIVTG